MPRLDPYQFASPGKDGPIYAEQLGQTGRDGGEFVSVLLDPAEDR